MISFSDLSDFAKYSMTRIVAQSLCNSWASCGYCEYRHTGRLHCWQIL